MNGVIFLVGCLCVAAKHFLMAAWFGCAEEMYSRLSFSPSTIRWSSIAYLLADTLGSYILGTLGDKHNKKSILCGSTSLSIIVYGTVKNN